LTGMSAIGRKICTDRLPDVGYAVCTVLLARRVLAYRPPAHGAQM
jgi:hypothetical protein